MLRELHIKNLAIIEDARIELAEGLNCFTGQTGAGKSLVLGAFEILLGLRARGGKDSVRSGAAEARVCGVFELHDPWVVEEIAAVADIELAPGDELLITRKIAASGRSTVAVNGQPATAAMARAIGELLVDIHGQHDHQYLLRPANQLTILDAFAQTLDQRRLYGRLYAELRETQATLEERAASQSLRSEQIELYAFQADEIDAAELIVGEYDVLKARHSLLNNLQRIEREAGAAHAALYESDGALVERLHMMAHVLGDLADLDPDLAPTAEQVRSAAMGLGESAMELGRYLSRLELGPNEIASLEDRLNTINRLAAKYDPSQTGSGAASPDPVERILGYRDQLEQRLMALRSEQEGAGALEARCGQLRDQMADLAKRLSETRRAAGDDLHALVEAQLQELGMTGAGFSVAFKQVDPGPTGQDAVEMLVKINPGQPAKPLREVASGGEMSRIMLAIKAILAQSDRISVLVFDEIDANIGGRMGTVIGQKLRALACAPTPDGTGRHQVLCITHLPQIAAFASHHLRIAKEVTGKGARAQTVTSISPLKGKERVQELAEMLAGRDVTSTTRKQAREMIAVANER